ncbi:MAG: hypothetical protein H0W52_14990 [Rubrobacteraceae bacterium]|nr:hypothetical protein [Rubrobacteraceae bacterium]
MASALENVVNRGALLDLAGERYFEWGEDYHHGGHVHDLIEHEGIVVARSAPPGVQTQAQLHEAARRD